MTKHYNLATEPWIPIRAIDGTRRSVSLRDLVADAQQIDDIEIYPPIAYAVLVRLAAAVLLRTQGAPLGAPQSKTWQQWGSERLASGPDTAALDAYLDQWVERFWLVHPTHPFLQDAAISHECDKRSTTNKLRMEAASGNNFLWWTKTADSDAPTLDHATAAGHLLAQWGYGSGGRCTSRRGISDSRQSPLRPRTLFLPRGNNLWSTLIACCAPATGDHALATRDRCTWERDSSDTPIPGQLGRLTESTRGLLLFGDAAGIHDAVITWGSSLPDTFFDSDVFTATRLNKDGSTSPYQLPIDRLAWAEMPALLAKLEADPERRVTRPTVLDPLTNPLGAADDFFAAGITTVTHFADKSKDIDWARSELPSVLAALEEHDPAAFARVGQYCQYAREAIGITHRTAKTLPVPGGSANDTHAIPDTEAFRRQLWLDAEQGFWSTARGAAWEPAAATLRTQCITAFAQATSNITEARLLTGVVLAERKLRSSFHHLDEAFGLLSKPKGNA